MKLRSISPRFTAATIIAAGVLAGDPAAAQRAARAPSGPEAPAADETAVAAPAAASVAPPTSAGASLLPSLAGPIGLYHLSTAEVGPRHHLRLALHGQYFASSSFLVPGDRDAQLAGALTIGFTPHENFEIFGGLFTASNRNDRTSEPGRTDPDVIKEHGDLVIGSKAILPAGRAVTLGLELGLRFLSSASGLAFAASSTSAWIGPLATLDLRPLAGPPLRFHANASFYADNSKNVYDFSGTIVPTRDVAAFAYGVAASRARFALGVDAPLDGLAVPLRPFAEYHAEIVTASADPTALMPGAAYGARDRQWLTFGLRARIYKGATLDAGADVRLQSNGAAYGPPLPPYDLIFGASYPLDVDSFTRPVIVTRTVEKPVLVPPPPATEGRVAGVARDKDGKAIAGAVVTVAGRAHAAVVTDADGTFETPALPPGPARLEISAADFEPEKVTAAVVAGRSAEVAVSLTAKVKTGVVRGKISDAQGHGVEATLRFNGAQAFEARSDSGGFYSAALVAGPYQVKADALGLPSKEGQLELAPGESRQLDLMLRPLSPDLTLGPDEIVLRAPIKFRAGAPRLTPRWQEELDGVALALEDHPEIRGLRIEAHWDSGAGDKVKALTESQAAAVKEYLVKKGVAESRLVAVGMGADQPMVPNVSSVYKAKNRRVELHTTK